MIFLINIPYGEIYGKINIQKINYGLPPLGLAYIASFLRANNKDVELIDMQFGKPNWNDVIEKIKKEKPRLIGFSSTTPQILTIAKIAKIIKGINLNIKIVVGGSHPSALPEETAAYEGIDVVVIGEGEETMLDLSNGLDFKDIKGICYRSDNQAIILNPERPLIENLDSLPYPAYDLLPVHKYGYVGLDNYLTVMSGRGCPYHCSFCASQVVFKGKYRMNNPEYFVGMLEKIKTDFGINNFEFCDETFTANYSQTIGICSLILKRKLKIKWACMIKANHINKVLLKIMKGAGCRRIEIGIESGDQGVLDRAHKGITLSQVDNAVNMINRERIETYGFFILGLPFENLASLKKTIEFSKRLKLDYAQFQMFVPLPGSEAYEIAKQGKVLRLLTDNWDDFCKYKDPIIESNWLSKQTLKDYYDKANAEFYFRFSMFWKILRKCNSWGKIKMFIKMAKALFKTI